TVPAAADTIRQARGHRGAGQVCLPDPAGYDRVDFKAARQIPRLPRHPADADLSSVIPAAQAGRWKYGILLAGLGRHDPGAAPAQAAGAGEEQEEVNFWDRGLGTCNYPRFLSLAPSPWSQICRTTFLPRT